ncbi:hypothetical protein AAKU67_004269 [Oxalobacteraceae bacterium GrIS 2.11]
MIATCENAKIDLRPNARYRTDPVKATRRSAGSGGNLASFVRNRSLRRQVPAYPRGNDASL